MHSTCRRLAAWNVPPASQRFRSHRGRPSAFETRVIVVAPTCTRVLRARFTTRRPTTNAASRPPSESSIANERIDASISDPEQVRARRKTGGVARPCRTSRTCSRRTDGRRAATADLRPPRSEAASGLPVAFQRANFPPVSATKVQKMHATIRECVTVFPERTLTSSRWAADSERLTPFAVKANQRDEERLREAPIRIG